MKNEKFDVSVVVATYHPSLEKLFVTLNSILIQKDVSVQIVITDDGSGDVDWDRVKGYFDEKGFKDYVISALEENGGTVKNLINGVKHSEGRYVKPISPGDYLYGERVLRKWMTGMMRSEAAVGFADCICYQYEKDMTYVSREAHPQKTHDFYRNSWAYNYLVFDDIAVGAATLVKREILEKYLGFLEGRVIYAEDHSYRLMAAAGERAYFLGKPAILYEAGTGISTGKNDVWTKRLEADWQAANDIILSGEVPEVTPDEKRKKAFQKAVKYRQMSGLSGMLKAARIPGKLRSVIAHRHGLRMTGTDVDEGYVERIHGGKM
ncbi:MAG: glycosyltransferase [Eubacterium sp.]|nr:glycosyltransferase [Eubacterium sp.]